MATAIKMISLFVGVIMLMTFMTGCTEQKVTAGVIAEKQDQVIERNNVFAWEMFKLLNKEDADENVFISPLSISTALTMTLNGANSSTEEAIKKALFYEGLDMSAINSGNKYLAERLTSIDKNITLNISNSIWVRDEFPVKKSFMDVNRDMFEAQVENIDFTKTDAAGKINRWIKDATEGMIEKMIDPPIPDNMIMYLINAIYFKGDWTKPFDPKMTFPGQFNGKDGKISDVEYMTKSEGMEYYENNGMKAVRLPYGKDKSASMVLILPDESVDIDTFIGELDLDTWNEIKSGLQQQSEVRLKMPKFKMEYGIKELKSSLVDLGMGEAFTNQADFTGISDTGVAIDTVMHKAVIDVHEKGSEAAAVTVVGIRTTSFMLDMPEFIADRPFVFVIADDVDQSILFMG
ncbi:MAG TPA: proteinase IV, partial [Clostridiales bacterium]|nr:proteinase IV [Clostridiales bacterium]